MEIWVDAVAGADLRHCIAGVCWDGGDLARWGTGAALGQRGARAALGSLGDGGLGGGVGATTSWTEGVGRTAGWAG